MSLTHDTFRRKTAPRLRLQLSEQGLRCGRACSPLRGASTLPIDRVEYPPADNPSPKRFLDGAGRSPQEYQDLAPNRSRAAGQRRRTQPARKSRGSKPRPTEIKLGRVGHVGICDANNGMRRLSRSCSPSGRQPSGARWHVWRARDRERRGHRARALPKPAEQQVSVSIRWSVGPPLP